MLFRSEINPELLARTTAEATANLGLLKADRIFRRRALTALAMAAAVAVASVAALRETSVLFAALLGTWLLREPFGWQRAMGTGVIVGGVVLLRLG